MNASELALAESLPGIFAAPVAAPPGGGPPHIPEGRRNASLASRGGQLRRVGLSPTAISAALHVENQERCSPPLPAREVTAIAESLGRYPTGATPTASPLVGLPLAELLTHSFPARRPIFSRAGMPVFCEGHLGQIFAERGIGKSWFAQSLALIAASGGSALGFVASGWRTLYVDGEMAAEETQGRFRTLVDRLGVSPTAPLMVLGADWQDGCFPRLDTAEAQARLEPFVEQADFIVLDNRSCLFDPEGEKDPSAWQPAQDWLLSLRRAGKAVLLVHHSNRQGGARGHSKAEDPLNLLIKLARPDNYRQDEGARFVVTFEKARGAYGAAVAPFEARLTPDGWHTTGMDGDGHSTVVAKLLAHVRLSARAGEPVRSGGAAVRGASVNRQAGLKAWADLLEHGAIRKNPEGDFEAP